MKLFPTVTVLIPTFNHERWIDFCLNSVLNQTYKHLEIIVVDDCSSDSTFEIAQKFSCRNISVVRNHENLGCSRSLNSIMNGIKSKYIAIVSGDDAWMIEKIETQVEFMEQNIGVDLCFTDTVTLNESNTIGPRFPYFHPENRTRPQWISSLFGGNFIPAMSAMFRNSSWFLNNRFDPSLRQLQDWEYWIRAICDGLKFHIIQSPLTLYRVLPDSISNQVSQEKMARSRFEVRVCLQTFKRLPIGELRGVFENIFENHPLYAVDRSNEVCLALLASTVDQGPYQQFAAELLHEYYRNGTHLITDLDYHNFIGSLQRLAVH